MQNCASCGASLEGAFCSSCGASAAHDDYSVRRTVGVLGAALVLIGVFLPFAHLPIVGDVNYFLNGHGDGVWLLIVAVIAAGLVFTRAYVGTALCGIATIGLLAHFYYRIESLKQEMLSRADSTDAGMFSGLVSNLSHAIADNVYIEWGFAVVVVGGLLLVLTPLIRARQVSIKPPVSAT